MNSINNNVDVSIVIVCMNNLENLYPCLDSIIKHTTVNYETLVVAYLFSGENLNKLKIDYPWITIIESNEIRGFSENNNLALRQAKGKYCFVLNDDTEILDSAIDKLVETFSMVPDNTAIVSPILLNTKWEIQVCGRPPLNWRNFILLLLHLWSESKGVYVNKTGVFQTYNIIGAAFLIKRDIFEKIGWFDEYYFFTPEDIALSTLLNNSGYTCYVNVDCAIIHKEGLSGKPVNMIRTATNPAAYKGVIHWLANGNTVFHFFLATIFFVIFFSMYCFHKISWLYRNKSVDKYILYMGALNVAKSIYSNQTPKEVFVKFYNEINNN